MYITGLAQLQVEELKESIDKEATSTKSYG